MLMPGTRLGFARKWLKMRALLHAGTFDVNRAPAKTNRRTTSPRLSVLLFALKKAACCRATSAAAMAIAF
jgi:hypothetical protein